MVFYVEEAGFRVVGGFCVFVKVGVLRRSFSGLGEVVFIVRRVGSRSRLGEFILDLTF